MAWRIPRAKIVHKTEPAPMPEHKRLYNTSRWRRNRLLFLQENPFCVECEKGGRMEMATDVDHVKPHRGNLKLFYNQRNWQALCHRCHGIKSAGERNGGKDDA